MPEKRNIYRSYGEKLISLFVRLLFSRESHSLTDLARMLNCSKQTVLRLVGDIQKAYFVNIEESFRGNRKYFRIQRPRVPPLVNLTEKELNVLQMCRSFSEHLLGRKLFEEATLALEKGRAFVPQEKTLSSQHFASFRPGSIDYTPHQDAVRALIEAMEGKRVCKLSYQSISAKRAKTFYIKPLKIFSRHDTLYLHARLARKPGKPYREPDYDPLLAIHRIKKVEITDRLFQFPKDYDFEKTFNQNFGIIKKESFEVEVELAGFAARYVPERMWSPDQKVVRKEGGSVMLTFTSSSKPELMAWVLSFGDEAKLIKPDWLVDEVRQAVERMRGRYSESS